MLNRIINLIVFLIVGSVIVSSDQSRLSILVVAALQGPDGPEKRSSLLFSFGTHQVNLQGV